MAFGELLDQVGGTGRFQVMHVTLLCIPILMMASHNLLQNFVAPVPPHHCSAHANLSLHTLTKEQVQRITVPVDEKDKPARCQRYATPQWGLLNVTDRAEAEEEDAFADTLDVELQGCQDGWEYGKTERSSTIITEWDLVCDQRSLKQMGQTIYMGGVLIGAVIFGGLSDKFGRLYLLQFSYLLLAVSGTCTAFATSFTVFCLFRFGCGMALSGLVLNTLSLVLEWIPTRVRTIVGTGTGYCYTIGQLLLALVAYFIRDWRWLTLAVSLPFYGFFIYSWWYLESARWLVLNRKSEKAVKNLQAVARINGRHAEGEKITLEVLQESMKKEMSCSEGSYSALDLVRTPVMRTITICLSAIWFSTSFGYYGLSMDLQKFGVDMYLIQVIFGAVDIPAKVIVTVAMSVFGRRPSQCASLILAGIAVLSNLLVPYEKQTMRTVLAVVGKGCLAASFNCCYLYSPELYPTVIRQNGMGFVSMTARFGAMVAPMVQLLGERVPWLPGLIYGGVPIISGFFAIFLPETLASPLPDTVQDVEERGYRRKNTKAKKEELPTEDTSKPLKDAA
ncbi:solute carrier family 22 member 6 [Clupea harengus]|uniref:Solute carrier family 22 member 6 n=1 Tax=Clupea harengus TaxID=7950 RepID=A0A6P3VNV6_CLUHA|nr:solute carrier family 22 member 6 [Clupea harengus]